MLRVAQKGSIILVFGLMVALTASACDGSDDSSRVDDDAQPAAGETEGLPVSAPEGPVDAALASRGEEVFRSRGCVACHQVGGGRLVGPDLQGVTERRSFEWTYHMVMNPDSMLRNDSIAEAMLQEYFTPMSDQNVDPEQFLAIYEYLRSQSR